MSKYYDALRRSANKREEGGKVHPINARIVARAEGLAQRSREIAPSTEPLTPVIDIPVVHQRPVPQVAPELSGAMARQEAIRQMCERIAPTAAVEKSCRIAVSGCRPRDGASSIAAALALDLSQRLSVRTLLVDANLQAPNLHRVISVNEGRGMEIALERSVQVRATGWPRLTLATCSFEGDDIERDLVMAELEPVLGTFSAVVIDLGVARLDPRMLPLVRVDDPIMLVVRYGQTKRHELATTATALRSANRTVAGVIFNGKPSSVRTSSSETSVSETSVYE